MPASIKKIIGDRVYTIDTVGMSDSQVILFDDMVLKIEKEREEVEKEYKMMEWLKDKLPVPKVLCREKEDSMSYLLMTKIGGEMCCADAIVENPQQLVRLLAEGLHMLWRVDRTQCPCSNDIEDVLKRAEIRVQQHLCDMEDAEPETYGEGGFANPTELLQWLKEHKPTQELVFSHGDYSLPNIFIKDGQVNGFIDLGKSGIADQYQDIALCYRSLKHHYEEIDATTLFEELNIEPDWDKIKYYILLDELF